MNPYLIYFTISLLSGIGCYLFAKRKGKNPYLWFGIGVVFSVIGLIIITLIKDNLKTAIKEE